MIEQGGTVCLKYIAASLWFRFVISSIQSFHWMKIKKQTEYIQSAKIQSASITIALII